MNQGPASGQLNQGPVPGQSQPGQQPFQGQPNQPNQAPFQGQPNQGPFQGQPNQGSFQGQPNQGPFQGQPNQGPFQGQPNQGPFQGQPAQPNQGPFQGQPNQGSFQGQPNQGPFQGQPNQAPFQGQQPFQGQPGQPGKGFFQKLLGQLGISGQPGQLGQPGQPGQPGQKKASPVVIALAVFAGIVALVIIGMIGNFLTGGNKTVEEEQSAPITPATFEESEDTEEENTANTEATEEAKEESDNTAKATASYDDSTMLSSFSISGNQFTLPVDINKLLESGWSYDDEADANEMVTAKSTGSIKLNYSEKGDGYVFFTVVNHSIDAQPVSKCMISGVDFSDRFVKQTGAVIKVCNDQFELQKTTIDEVKAALGDASNTSQDGNSASLTYKGKEGEAEYKLRARFEFDNDILTSFSLDNRLTPEDFDQPEVSTDTPEYLSLYKAPSSLGDDILSGNVSIDGVVYNIPAPLSLFTDNGWVMSEDIGTLPSAHYTFVTLKKGDCRLEVNILNPLSTAVTAENTIVTKVSAFRSKYNDFGFTLPGEIKTGTPKDDLDKYLNNKGIKNFTYDEKYHVYKIPYDQNDKSDFVKEHIRISIDEDDNTILSIDAERYAWLFEE